MTRVATDRQTTDFMGETCVIGVTCPIDEARDAGVARPPVDSWHRKKEAPLSRGSLVACLLVCGGVFSLFLFLFSAVFVEPLAKEESKRCARGI
jgi:hypothetical protein